MIGDLLHDPLYILTYCITYVCFDEPEGPEYFFQRANGQARSCAPEDDDN